MRPFEVITGGHATSESILLRTRASWAWVGPLRYPALCFRNLLWRHFLRHIPQRLNIVGQAYQTYTNT